MMNLSPRDQLIQLRPAGGFDFIMADPPWSYEMYSDKGYSKSPEAQYATMTPEAIKALPVELLAAKNCLLWLWCVGPQVPLALQVISAWGFTFKTLGWWAKTTKNDKQAFGTGYILRNAGEPYILAECGSPLIEGEPFLIGTRGAPKTTRATRNTIMGLAREHSRKPEEAFADAEKLMPHARRIELFSRTDRPGWAAWGDETGKFAGSE
jgi:N6-adenosine-specific RNA methylase IME4